MKLSETAAKVIELAGRVRAYYEVELPKHHPDYPIIGEGEKGPPPPPEERKLKRLLSSLPIESLHQLLLLMYLGRMDFGVDDLAENYDELRRDFTQPDQAIDQMTHYLPLGDQLSDGLEELRKHGIDVDDLPLESKKKVSLRKG